MMTNDEILNVVQAYKDGKEIQVYIESSDKWLGIEEPAWNFHEYKYRINPESNYVPYDSVEEIDKNKWVRRKDTRVDRQIVMVDNGRNQIAVLEINNWLYWLKLIDMFREWEYEDGTPFGKLVQS